MWHTEFEENTYNWTSCTMSAFGKWGQTSISHTSKDTFMSSSFRRGIQSQQDIHVLFTNPHLFTSLSYSHSHMNFTLLFPPYFLCHSAQLAALRGTVKHSFRCLSPCAMERGKQIQRHDRLQLSRSPGASWGPHALQLFAAARTQVRSYSGSRQC